MKKFLMMLIAAVMFMPAIASAQINWYGQLDIMGSMNAGRVLQNLQMNTAYKFKIICRSKFRT
jgi:opacity protein-like surface antigen